jgi:hypothetical protein
MFVLAVGFDAVGDRTWSAAVSLNPAFLTVNVGSEAEMLAALDFACFDAIVIDLDREAPWMFDILKLQRFAMACDSGLPAIGCASVIDVPLQERCSDAGIRLIVDQSVSPQQISDHLHQVCGTAARPAA